MFSEDPLWSQEANKAKLEHKKTIPKVYRENGGRWSKRQNKIVKFLHEEDCNIQAEHEDNLINEMSDSSN